MAYSSFYGLLDILSGTELNAGQREIGRLLFRAELVQLLILIPSANRKAIMRAVVEGTQRPEYESAEALVLTTIQIIDSILDYSKLEADGATILTLCTSMVC